MKIRNLKQVLLAFCATILLIVSGCGTSSAATTTTTTTTPYDDAVALMESGDYEAAIEAFEVLTDAEDADQKIIECQYALGLKAMENEEWEKAISYFAVLDYSESSDKIIECQYLLGMEAMEESRWSTAISFLSNLDYEDSAAKVLECQYNQGLEAMNSGDWTLAIEYLAGISYEDSESRIAECNYNLGLETIEAGDLELAISYLDSLDYNDAAEQAASCKYQLGSAALEAEEWETAISYFENLDYEDSAELLEYCIREKGMHENADYDFLADLEASILNRMEDADSGEVSNALLVSTELAYIEKYAEMTFYDEGIKVAANKYIEGLYIQQDADLETYKKDYYTAWYQGMAYRFDALKELYDNYGFLNDNVDFIARYISRVDEIHMWCDAYEIILDDMYTQLMSTKVDVKASKNRALITLTNNTDYSFSLTFYMYFYDSDDVLFENSSTTISNINPGKSYEISCYISDGSRVDTITVDCYLGDLSYNPTDDSEKSDE